MEGSTSPEDVVVSQPEKQNEPKEDEIDESQPLSVTDHVNRKNQELLENKLMSLSSISLVKNVQVKDTVDPNFETVTYNEYLLKDENDEDLFVVNELGSTCGDCLCKQFCGPRRPFSIAICTKTKVPIIMSTFNLGLPFSKYCNTQLAGSVWGHP